MLYAEAEVHQLSVEDVYRMANAGVLGEEERVELIDGVLVDVHRPGPSHSSAVAWLIRHFAGATGGLEIRIQDPLLVEGGFLLPDLMVIEPPPRDRHPSTAALVAEVALTTQRHDAWKASRYAAAGVAEYWIVDLAARLVVFHRDPLEHRYREISRYGENATIPTPVGAPAVEVLALIGPPE